MLAHEFISLLCLASLFELSNGVQGASNFAFPTLSQPEPMGAVLGQDATAAFQERVAPDPATGPRPSTSPACSTGRCSRPQRSDAKPRGAHVEFSRAGSTCSARITPRSHASDKIDASRQSCSSCTAISGSGAAVDSEGGGSRMSQSLSRFPRHEPPKPPEPATFRPTTAIAHQNASGGRRAASVGDYLPRPDVALGSVRPQTYCGRTVGRIHNKSLWRLHCSGGVGGADVLQAATSITVDQRHELV